MQHSFRGAQAARLLVAAARRNELYSVFPLWKASYLLNHEEKFATARARSPAREPRALPRHVPTTHFCFPLRAVD